MRNQSANPGIRQNKRDSGREGDPYLSKNPPRDMSVCGKCHAVYHNKHWILDEELCGEVGKGKSSSILCPACQKIEDHFPMGVIHLQGDYLEVHKEEILNLVRNEEKRARGFNPLERIETINDRGGSVSIETTNEKLAQRIGKRLLRAHQGRVRYRWSGDNKFIRVDWERTLPPKR